MSITFSDLYSTRGSLKRHEYALAGLILFAVKYNLDRIVAAIFFHRVWGILEYLSSRNALDADHFGNDQQFLSTLLLCALPFIWTGTVLTIRRLRDAGYSPRFVLLFFVPILNLLFFLILSLVPTKVPVEGAQPTDELLAKFIPRSDKMRDYFALFVGAVVMFPFMLIAIYVFHDYGFGLFVGIPFATGFITMTLAGYHKRLTLGHTAGLCAQAVLVQGLILLGFAFEGVICLLMALPIAFLLTWIGGILAWQVMNISQRYRPNAGFYCIVIILPFWIGLEGDARFQPPEIEAITSVEIHASPEMVWKNVVQFAELPPPDELLFHTGIAYPIRARITGTGVGAVRKCEFSTGPFIEPITKWDEPRLLAFDVASSPEPMKELSIWGDIHPPHLNNFMQSKHGQFELIALPNGDTRLVGTTWYTHAIWPSSYWSLFSDYIIHTIHHRVLQHIKNLSEKEAHP
jgi:uncharacterized membrane protein YhaH (DUF805 family)